MGEQRGLAPLLTVDLASVTVDPFSRDGGLFPLCIWTCNSEIDRPLLQLYDHTGSKKVSGLFGSKISLQVITVTRSSVSLRLMMLCVQPGIM